MTASSKKKSSGPVLPPPSTAGASSGFASYTSKFSSRFTTFSHRSTSPTRAGTGTGQPVIRKSHQQKRTCMCSPSTHPGSFRCSLHKSSGSRSVATSPYSLNRLKARRSAMMNSLARIRGVEGGDFVKRALAALIRPSPHQKQRRSFFRPRPSRLSAVSKAEGYS